MTDDELLEYIKNRKYLCCFCSNLKKQVLKNGLKAIDDYDGMICGGVQDMISRRMGYYLRDFRYKDTEEE